MAKIITTIKAILTRIIFSAHSLIAIWQVTQNKNEPIWWCLCGPIGLLAIEGVFTLAIKKNQEWRWFCPSVFLYLGSVVPAIWLLELDKVERRLRNEEVKNIDIQANFKQFGNLLPPNLTKLAVDAETWTTLIEQFLMLILIVGRWLLPKGDLTRDQLSQLLLVYIGTAADIIEFFDSYKDNEIAKKQLLVFLTLGIWSWSLLQFTIVLSATRSRKPRGGGSLGADEPTDCCGDCCCGIDVWGIALNVILQDAPFLAFRLLIIVHYRLINYMNVFFTCKNSLVILLQLYRLYVVYSEYWKARRQKNSSSNKKTIRDDSDDEFERKGKSKKDKYKKHNRKDTGYSTASSQNLHSIKLKDEKQKRKKDKRLKKLDIASSNSDSESEPVVVVKKKGKQSKKDDDRRYTSKKDKHFDAVMEESNTTTESSSSLKYEVINEKKKKKKKKVSSTSSSSSSSSSS
ncbi:transmembrane protein 26 [Condylostylus longicornis]|uniref:transmembrane protein 26 n=1 Tax=Condylostylus longicornis TaxID=2530218 RepID=UPI00244E1C24|nr:transmembrane protein 26 [Condylostylus longicornis]